MIILGLDLSKTNSGWCYLDAKDHKAARSGSFRSEGDWESAAWDFSGKLIKLFKNEGKPDFCVIEQPMRNVQQFKKKGTKLMPELESDGMTVNPKSSLIVNQITGAAVGVLRGYGIPFETITSGTWRKGFFVKGTKGKNSADWKRLAKRQCELLGIDVRNADQAEAVGVAFAAPNCDRYRLIKHNLENKMEAAQ